MRRSIKPPLADIESLPESEKPSGEGRAVESGRNIASRSICAFV
jgi:hypothetical protein